MAPIVAALIGSACVFFLGWWSVQNLIQARLLSRWRLPSMDGLDRRKAAIYGEVRVQDPLHIYAVGDCLWHRKVVKSLNGKTTRTVSDVVQMAGFCLVVEGREFRLPEFPTEVHGGESATNGWDIGSVIGDGGLATTERWLPVVDHLTAVGQVRKNGARWEVARDPVAGLLFTAHHPKRTAMKEYVKAGLGFAATLATLYAVIWAVSVLR